MSWAGNPLLRERLLHGTADWGADVLAFLRSPK
jgi:hypothetical protein